MKRQAVDPARWPATTRSAWRLNERPTPLKEIERWLAEMDLRQRELVRPFVPQREVIGRMARPVPAAGLGAPQIPPQSDPLSETLGHVGRALFWLRTGRRPLYHGTGVRFAEQICREGVRPLPPEHGVFITPNLESAWEYALNASGALEGARSTPRPRSGQ